MAEAPPEPPVPADCDLRDFPFMPLEIGRLFGSAFHARANDAEWRAGVTLWLKSYHQVPGGSLPDDDIELCRLAELGRNMRMWRKIRAMALHGWSKHSDGRLYHATVAEKVREGWHRKRLQRERSRKGNVKRWSGAPPGTDDGGGAPPTRERSTSQGRVRAIPQGKPSDPCGTATGIPEGSLKDSFKDPCGTATGIPEGSLKDSLRDPLRIPRDSKGKRREEIPPPLAAAPPATAREAAAAEVDQAYRQWSALATERGWPDTGFLNGERRAALRARLHEIGGLPGWATVLGKLREAEFLMEADGRPKRWFNLAWMLKPESFTGLMEGRYAERRKPKSATHDNLAALAELARESPG